MSNQQHQQQAPHPTVQQISTMVDGQVITGIQGTLTRIYPRKTGMTTDNREWSIQNGEITDNQGQKISLFIKDRDAIPESMKGDQITVTSNQTANGFHGVKVMDDEYKGNVTRKLKITRSANITQVLVNTQEAPPFGVNSQGGQQQQQHTNQAGLEDPPFDEPNVPGQNPNQEYYPDMDQVQNNQQQQHPEPTHQTSSGGRRTNPVPQNQGQPQQPTGKDDKPVPELPAGANVRSITYREVRQKAQYEPVTFEMTVDVEPDTKLSKVWIYCERAADAMLKHSTGR